MSTSLRLTALALDFTYAALTRSQAEPLELGEVGAELVAGAPHAGVRIGEGESVEAIANVVHVGESALAGAHSDSPFSGESPCAQG